MPLLPEITVDQMMLDTVLFKHKRTVDDLVLIVDLCFVQIWVQDQIATLQVRRGPLLENRQHDVHLPPVPLRNFWGRLPRRKGFLNFVLLYQVHLVDRQDWNADVAQPVLFLVFYDVVMLDYFLLAFVLSPSRYEVGFVEEVLHLRRVFDLEQNFLQFRVILFLQEFRPERGLRRGKNAVEAASCAVVASQIQWRNFVSVDFA